MAKQNQCTEIPEMTKVGNVLCGSSTVVTLTFLPTVKDCKEISVTIDLRCEQVSEGSVGWSGRQFTF